MKKINILTLVKFQTILMAVIGLLAGITYSFWGLIIDTLVTYELFVTSETPGLSYGTLLAFGALIGMPLIFAFVGLIAGLIEGVLYNLFSKWLSGLEINFEK